MPDFDIDFCQDRRDEVIDYVQERYGKDQVAQIITFGKLQARMVTRDVGRVLQMPYGQVDRLSKLIPMNPANPVTLAQAIAGEPRLQEERDRDPMVKTLFEIALKLEGLYRNASTHAAGIVIGDRPLEELVPLYRDPRSAIPATQFNMKYVEKAGLVKFDFLGLKTLTVIDKAQKLIRLREPSFDIERIPYDDAKTYEMLGHGDTVGVFQLESSGMRDVLRKMRADCIEDIIAIVALYRPGADGQYSALHRLQEGRGAAGLSASADRADPEGNLRHHGLSGAGDADRPGALGLFAGRSRSSAPRHGQEDQVRNGRAEGALRQGRHGQGHRGAPGRLHLRAGGEIRRLRLQQVACRGLRGGRLSDGLSQGQLSGGISGRLDVARHRQYRQAACCSAAKRRGWALRSCRHRSMPAASISR